MAISKEEKNKLNSVLINLRVRQGYSTTSLIEYIKENYNVSNSTAYRWLKESRELMGKIYNELYEDSMIDSIYFMEGLRELAVNESNIKMALEVQKEINKVSQLYVIKQEVTVKTEQPLFN